ncbi:MAG TPA: hypothetical protein VHW44_31815 [Pseudonocardiaceae bacterium]|jgi:hypothetical protein|nr:hypothetical protein [Pseudonocardiaceae bacterium]
MPYAPTRSSDITPLVPGLLYRIGSVVPADHLSWLPWGATGYEPLNCYLYLLPDTAVFIDTCPAISAPAVRQALAELVGDRQLLVFPTRNEAECVGNLGLLLARGRDARLLFGGGGGILEWINHPDAPPGITDNFLGVTPIDPAANGTSTEIGSLHFDWMDAAVKEMFLTQWAYERTTKTLFTSDFFGWQHLAAAGDPVLHTAADSSPDAAVIAGEIVNRINWLPGAYCPDVLARFASVMSEYDVEIIAPVHGAVLAGRELVARSVDLANAALAALTSPVPA